MTKPFSLFASLHSVAPTNCRPLCPAILAATLCCVLTAPARADMPSIANLSSMPAPAASRPAPMLLGEDALDTIAAGGVGGSGGMGLRNVTSTALASADRGRAFALSTAQTVESPIVAISLSQSLAIAVGQHAFAVTRIGAQRN